MQKKKRTMPLARLWWIIPASWVVLITTQNILFRPSAEEITAARQELAKFLIPEAPAEEYNGPPTRFMFYYSWDCSRTPAWRDNDFGTAAITGIYRSYEDQDKPGECTTVISVATQVNHSMRLEAGPFRGIARSLLDWISIGHRRASYINQGLVP